MFLSDKEVLEFIASFYLLYIVIMMIHCNYRAKILRYLDEQAGTVCRFCELIRRTLLKVFN